MNPLGVARKCRTAFRRVVADGDDVVELPMKKTVERLWMLAGHVDVEQSLDGFLRHRMNVGLWGGAGAFNLNTAGREMPKDRFGHLRPCRITGAEKKDIQRLSSHPYAPLALCSRTAASAVFGNTGTSQLNRSVAAVAPSI